jgi:hypothetical protein
VNYWVHRVYFAGIAPDGPVKIGTSQTPLSRMTSLRWATRQPIELLATIPGGMSLERRFHLHFLDDWLGCEWFRRSPAIMQAVEVLRAGEFDIDELPEKRQLPRALLWQRPDFLSPAPSSRAGAKAASTGSAPRSPVGAAGGLA